MRRFAVNETDQALILNLSGEIIMEVVTEFKAAVERRISVSSKPCCIVDLTQVTFMDSSGVGFLIGLKRLCLEQGKQFGLQNLSPPIKKLLEMLRLCEYFAISCQPGGQAG